MSEIDWDTPEIAVRYDKNCDHQFLKGRALVEMMGIATGDTVLDVGCGTGRQAVYVSWIIGPSGKLTGIDPSSHRIELCREKFSGNQKADVTFLVGQAEDLRNIPDQSLDYAYFCSSFHWVDDKSRDLNEIFRVLKPGGKVGMTTLDKDSPHIMREIVDAILEKYNVKRTHERQGGKKRVTATELHDLFTVAGFTEIIIEPRYIPRQYRSPEDVMNHLSTQGGTDYLLKDLPEDTRQKIGDEIKRELNQHQGPDGIGFGNITLFAVATKPDELCRKPQS
ncbi:methyltransferase domain-containing protein [Methanoregula sp.]|uniref:methyltransferase domain-containing protein n=1 Tax=Methanoregula sp. TaxID=2052170 RepID=UPI003C7082E9